MDAQTAGDAVPANFAGDPEQFFGLALRGSLLQIPTFGFYRFWLLTDVRRHLWSNTRFGSESLEYTGLARELLIGFLLALAILSPIYLAYFWLAIEAERLRAFASVPLFLLLYVLARFGSYRARRYRATRTVFRGLRLSMSGSGWYYAGLALFWDVLSVLTLGLCVPWRAAALERYMMRHTYYGDLPGAFVGTGWSFFKRGWWLWAICLLAIAGCAILFATMSMTLKGKTNAQETIVAIGVISLLTTLILFLLFMFGWPLFRAIQLRWKFDGVRFGDAAFKSALTKGSVLRCYLKAWGAGFLLFVALGILSGVALYLAGPIKNAATSPAHIVVMFLSYLPMILGVGLIKLQFLDRGVWAAVVGSLAISNMFVLDSAVARGEPSGSLGEGLVDALDFGAGL